jgi:hypothetical protein
MHKTETRLIKLLKAAASRDRCSRFEQAPAANKFIRRGAAGVFIRGTLPASAADQGAEERRAPATVPELGLACSKNYRSLGE